MGLAWEKAHGMRVRSLSWVSWVEIALIGAGVLCLIGGNQLSSPLLSRGGLALIGLGLIVVGGEAMVTRRFALRRRRHDGQVYRGLSAILYGIVYLWIGLALVTVSLVVFPGTEQVLLQSLAERPGYALLSLSFLLVAASGIELTGRLHARSDAKTGRFLSAISTLLHSIPGLLLFLLALAIMALGVLEIVSPDTFDELGGGFLEALFSGGSS
jgi:hypothetical protein